MRILIIEGDPVTASLLSHAFEREGHCCDPTDNGEDGIEIAKIYSHDLFVIDLDLSGLPGAEVIRGIRRAGIRRPILALTRPSDLEGRLRALHAGADDAIGKTAPASEIIARACALVRRTRGFAAGVIAVGKLAVDLLRRTVAYDGMPIHLTRREFAVLEVLALRKDAAVSKEAILSQIYLEDETPELKVIDVYVCKIRRKLLKATGNAFIQTVWGQGYALRDRAVAPDAPMPFGRIVAAIANPTRIERRAA